jgi:hypothetical protein
VGALVLMNLEGEDERNLFGLVFVFVGVLVRGYGKGGFYSTNDS